MNNQSERFKRIQRAVAKIKQDKCEKQIEEFGYVRCECCGKSRGEPLDASHLIPRSFSIAAQNIPENIWLHCRTCHRRWERNDTTMAKYNQMMTAVKELSPEYWAMRVNKAI